MIDRVDINRLLVEMRAMKAQSNAFVRPDAIASREISGVQGPKSQAVGQVSEVPSFGDLMSQAVHKVNDLQKTSSDMASAYERGVEGVDITDVMIASQKSAVSFQAMVQVRNKVIEAYRDVMNMPI